MKFGNGPFLLEKVITSFCHDNLSFENCPLFRNLQKTHERFLKMGQECSHFLAIYGLLVDS